MENQTPFQNNKQLEQAENFIPKLLRWAYRFSPIVSLDQDHGLSSSSEFASKWNSPTFGQKAELEQKLGPDRKLGTCIGINLDVTGSERLFRGEQRLLARIQAELKSSGLQSRLCIAPTLGCAWAVSRFSDLHSRGNSLTEYLSDNNLDLSVIVQTNTMRKHIEPLPI